LFDVRSQISYAFLRSVKLGSRLFFGYEVKWVGDVPDDPWADARIITILNHTSLYEPLFAGGAPDRVLKQIAGHGVVPVADKTVQRPLVGRFFRLVAEDVMPITRERDDTWDRLKTGLDLSGNPMTIRGGIADIIRAVPDGRMLLCYSRGLHHIQAPGELLPRLFRTVKARLETVDLPTYREKLLESAGEEGFKRAVIEDLSRRRDLYCY
jgi:hypothetical protein